MDSKYFKTVPKEIFLRNRYGSTQMHSFHCGFPIQEKSIIFHFPLENQSPVFKYFQV